MLDQFSSGLNFLGGALSAPGDYARGLLAGRPGERATGRDLLAALGLDPGSGLGGDIAGFGVEVATDPLTFLGAGLGARLGLKAGRAASAMGPGFETSADDLLRMVEHAGPQAARRADDILSSPSSARLLSEIDPRSTFLGSGAEGIAFANPGGNVTRVGKTFAGTAGRPIDEGVLQATAAKDLPNGTFTTMRVERTPRVEMGIKPDAWDELDMGLIDRGLNFSDRAGRNAGMLGGRPVVLDPGAVEATERFAGGFQPVMGAAEATADPGLLMRALVELGGGRDAIRRSLDAGRAGPNFAPQFALTGGGLGGNLGAWGR